MPEYQRLCGAISGLYYEPRGDLHHPHEGDDHETVPLGTREVEANQPPDWTYDKILVVEKASLWPVLRTARVADRYDMAVITSGGFAVEACRSLLAAMPPEDVRIFACTTQTPPGTTSRSRSLEDAPHCPSTA